MLVLGDLIFFGLWGAPVGDAWPCIPTELFDFCGFGG